MKTKPGNTKWQALLLLGAALAIAAPKAHAQQSPGAPQQRRPSPSEDVTDFLIDPREAEAGSVFVNEAGVKLKDLLANLSRWSYVEARDKLISGINRAISVGDEEEKTLMRTALKRGLMAREWIEQDTYPGAPGLIDASVRVLWRSIKFSQFYAEFDKKFYESQLASRPDPNSARPTAEFGLRYNRFICELDDSIVGGKTQFKVLFASVGWLYKDIKQDPLQNYLGETAAKLADTQLAMRSFYERMIKNPEQIRPREYISATKELRWGIQNALKAIPANFPQPWQSSALDRLLYE